MGIPVFAFAKKPLIGVRLAWIRAPLFCSNKVRDDRPFGTHQQNTTMTEAKVHLFVDNSNVKIEIGRLAYLRKGGGVALPPNRYA